MYRPICLCADIPSIELATKIVVLMHYREQKLTTNTATLACLALPNSELHIRGEKGERVDVESFLPKEGEAVLLYPTDDALELNAETLRSLRRPLTLVVPDGSWRQARKVASREPELLSIRRVKLPPGPPSNYRLRYSPHEENLSTFEAISRAIGIIEGPAIQEKLDELFLKKVERTLWSRGKLKPQDTVTGIPPEAIEASRIAGIQGGVKSRKRSWS
jgi:DTW domain-containing protein YfiP